MLPLIRTSDRIRVVCTADSSCALDDADREPIRWVPEAEGRAQPEAMVATIRPLSGQERLRSGLGEDVIWDVLCLGVVALSGPGVPADVRSAMRAIPAVYLAALSRVILRITDAPDDPFVHAGSVPSSISTHSHDSTVSGAPQVNNA